MQHRTRPSATSDRILPGPVVRLPQHVIRRGRQAAAALDAVRPVIEKLAQADDPELRAAAYHFERGVLLLELIEHRGLVRAIASIRAV